MCHVKRLQVPSGHGAFEIPGSFVRGTVLGDGAACWFASAGGFQHSNYLEKRRYERHQLRVICPLIPTKNQKQNDRGLERYSVIARVVMMGDGEVLFRQAVANGMCCVSLHDLHYMDNRRSNITQEVGLALHW